LERSNQEEAMNTLRRMISSIDTYTLWAFNPQPPLDRRS
jgi:hypothetical protein